METVVHCEDLMRLVVEYLNPHERAVSFNTVCRGWRKASGTPPTVLVPPSPDRQNYGWFLASYATDNMLSVDKARCVVVTHEWMKSALHSDEQHYSVLTYMLMKELIANPHGRNLQLVVIGLGSKIFHSAYDNRQLLYTHPRMWVATWYRDNAYTGAFLSSGFNLEAWGPTFYLHPEWSTQPPDFQPSSMQQFDWQPMLPRSWEIVSKCIRGNGFLYFFSPLQRVSPKRPASPTVLE